MNLFFQPKLAEGHLELDETESQHAIKVLRHQVGDKIFVTDGQGNLYHCEISALGKRTCSVQIQKTIKQEPPKHHIHIAMAPTKSADRTEWFVEKVTEIGVQEISFIQSQRSERQKLNVDRMTKTAIAAIKQSGQVWLPRINGLIDFADCLKTKANQKFIAAIPEKEGQSLQALAKKEQSYLVLIGPEGDFTTNEIVAATQAGLVPVSLGKNTLRTETAGMAACHILNLIQE